MLTVAAVAAFGTGAAAYCAVLRGFGLAIPVMHVLRGSAPTAPDHRNSRGSDDRNETVRGDGGTGGVRRPGDSAASLGQLAGPTHPAPRRAGDDLGVHR